MKTAYTNMPDRDFLHTTFDAPNQSKLLNKILEEHNLKNDAALARFLQVNPPVISKLRHKSMSLSHFQIVRICEATGWSIPYVREVLDV